MRFGLPRKRSVWDLALLALGLNLWVCFLLLPVAYLDRLPSHTVLLLVGAAPLALLAGVALREQVLLLAVFPLLLVLPAALSRSLVSVYTPWTFTLVLVSFLAYLLCSLFALQSLQAPATPTSVRDLGDAALPGYWRRRLRMYRWLAALAGIFPAVFIFTLFLHPGVQADMQRHFPSRSAEAQSFFGVLAVALWLGLFWAEFWMPLRAHVRGDPQTRAELEHLRHEARRAHPRARFYVYVALALGLMAALLLGRG